MSKEPPTTLLAEIPTNNIHQRLEELRCDLYQKYSARFRTQKEIEAEWLQKTHPSIQSFMNQTDEWMLMFDSLVNSFKELGSLSTWVESMEREMHIIAWTVQNLSPPQDK